MTTATDVLNQALQIIGGDQPLVTGSFPTFDGSTPGKVAAVLYGPCVRSVGRQFGWDFARHTVALNPTGNVAPFPWLYEFAYPSNGVQVWQVLPAADADVNNPLPVNWAVANAVVGANQGRVIHTNLAAALAVYNNAPNENTWDDLFREAVVRLLASELAMALAGKPDLSETLLQSGAAFETLGEDRAS